jgi:exopolyphosphatase / guanosine-5'-triphosphate,3'-diphosphate pyrophosphatase
LIFGAIDIGTNAARLLIGEVVEDKGHAYVKKISYNRVPLRLGFEVFTDGIISQEKTEMFIKTIEAFKLMAEVYGVTQLRACATSAMREAINGKKIQKSIKKQTNVNVEIIDGEVEAKLIFSTFMLLRFDKSTPFVVIDVGGGSTEISVFEKGRKVAGMSFKVGTIRILKGKVDAALWKEMDNWLIRNVDLSERHKVFATGGNINKIHKSLNKTVNEPVSIEELISFHKELSQLSIEERIDKFQFKEDRADVIVPACEIYEFVAERIGANELFVPKIGLSDGMIYSMHLQAMKAKKKVSKAKSATKVT